MIKALTDRWQLPLSPSHLFSHTAKSKYSILLLHLKQMLKFCKTLTFVLLLELPEAVPFILQYCSASLAMSEINFWEAREIRRILKKEKGKSLLWFSQSGQKVPLTSFPLPRNQYSSHNKGDNKLSPRHKGLYLHTYMPIKYWKLVALLMCILYTRIHIQCI